MTTINLPRVRVRESAIDVGGFQPPSYALRDMPSLEEAPKDGLSRDIATLLGEHPAVAQVFNQIDLCEMSAESKSEMLSQIKDMLGIKPLRKRHLGYVGP